MATHEEVFGFWIDRLAELEGVSMDADALVEDVIVLAAAFNQDPDVFPVVMMNVIKAFQNLLHKRNAGQPLTGNHVAWLSFHFQSRAIRKLKADMRIVYRDTGSTLEILGFGHRWIPQEIYHRLSLDRRKKRDSEDNR